MEVIKIIDDLQTQLDTLKREFEGVFKAFDELHNSYCKQCDLVLQLKAKNKDAEQCAIDFQNKNTKLEIEIEELKNVNIVIFEDNKKLEEENLNLQQQLKEKDELLEKWQEKAVVINGALDVESFNQILKTNTHQVCEKIRERYDLSSQPTEFGFANMISLENLSQFLDQIESEL